MINVNGIFTIYKRKAIFENGEWKMGEIVDVIESCNSKTIIDTSRFIDGWTALSRQGQDYMFINEVYAHGPGGSRNFTNYETLGTRISSSWTPPAGSTAGYWTLRHRFDPPTIGNTRTIRSIIITNGEHSYNYPGVLTGLAVPCIQPDNIILDIFYRITVENQPVSSNTTVNQKALDYLGKEFAFCSTGNYNSLAWYPNDLMFDWWNKNPSGIFTRINSMSTVTTPTTEYNYTDFYRDLSTEFSLSDSVGELHGTVYTGNELNRYSTGDIIKRPGDSSIQNIFGRKPGNNKPYLDVDNEKTGTGSIAVTDTTGWNGNTAFAKKYKIMITNGGATGVAEYKFKVSEFLGTNGSTFDPRLLDIGTLPKTNDYDEGTIDSTTETRHGVDFTNHVIFSMPYVYPEFIMADSTGLTIMGTDLLFENIDSSSTIPFNAVDITQIAVVPDGSGTILVSDAATGLWKIDRNLSTRQVIAITQITPSNVADSSKCRGITIKKSTGDWWAIFDKEMATSSDGGVTWTVYNEGTATQFKLTGYTGPTDDPSKIQHITIHDSHADDRFFISVPQVADGTRDDGFWWSRGGSSGGTSDEVSISVSVGSGALSGKRLIGSTAIYAIDESGVDVWLFKHVGRVYRYSWQSISNTGNSTSFCLGYYSGINLYEDNSGQTYIIGSTTTRDVVARLHTHWNTNNYSVLLNDNTINNGPYSPSSSYFIHRYLCSIGKNVHVYEGTNASGSYSTYRFHFTQWMNNTLDQNQSIEKVWDEYGWNSTTSQWELGNSSSKLTHSSTETLIDGLDISFSDGGSAPHFVTDEWFDVYVYDGILKDDATSYSYSMGILMGINEETTVFDNAVVPSSVVGPVTAEDGYGLSSFEDTVQRTFWYMEPKYVSRTQYTNASSLDCLMEEKLSGEFEIRIIPESFSSISNNYERTAIILQQYSNSIGTRILSLSYSFHDGDPSGATGNVYVRDNNGTIVHTESITDGSPTDVYHITRDNSDIVTLSRNGIGFFTFPSTISGDLQLRFYEYNAYNYKIAFSNIEVDYTIDRIYVKVGDSANQTGIFDPNFRKIVTEPKIADKYNEIYLDGVPAQLIYDGFTAPGPGQVTVMPYSGRLWFNVADAGKAITGKIRYLKKINLQ